MIEPVNLILALAAVALLPFLAVAASSYIKISVVLMLIRNAIGAQQTPPNMALNALALILSVFIMAPVIFAIYDIAKTLDFHTASASDFEHALTAAQAPLLEFLRKHTGARELLYFKEVAMTIWPESMHGLVKAEGLLLVLPAFTLTELRTAFEIGFLLYLPFIVIDLVVSNILLAMGMMMVSPLTISLPFKLLLFVMVDGWSKLILSLVKTYA